MHKLGVLAALSLLGTALVVASAHTSVPPGILASAQPGEAQVPLERDEVYRLVPGDNAADATSSIAFDGVCDEDCRDPHGPPIKYSIGPALPNPARRSTRISYAVPGPGSHVTIKVFDVRGRLTTTLVDEAKGPGTHVAPWDGKDADGNQVSPGVYYVYMQSGDFGKSSKVMVIR